jgi:tetratricopeptide (TPR) repeat protein
MLEASGSSYQNLSVVALFYESAKKYDLAEKTYLQAVEAAPKEDVAPLMNLGAYYARTKSYEKALEAMQKAKERKPDDLNVQVNIAQLQFDFNQLKDAEATVDKVLEKEKGNVGGNYLKGRLLLARNEYATAQEKFDLIVRESPKNAGAHYFRALCHLGKGESKLAQQDLLKAVELNPGLFEARLILAEFYLRERNQDLARQQIDAALKMAPRNVRALMLQGGLKLLERDAKAAEEVYRKVIEIDPGNAPAYVQLGLIQNLTGRQKEALDSFNKALELNPKQTDALALVVAYDVREKKFDEALKACEAHKKKVVDSQANLAQIEYLEGNIFLAKKETKLAQERFKKAMDTDPNLAAPYLALAQIYVREKKYDEAVAEYESILAKNPKYLAGYMSIGTIHDLKGDGAEAEKYYRKALEIKKDFGPAANNLAWNLADRGGNIDEALTYAQIAKEQMPDSAAVMDTLGWIYYLKGSYLNAIAEFQDSLARDPSNAVINYHMGLAQYKNDDKTKAKEYLDKALELDANFKGADGARKVLKEMQG